MNLKARLILMGACVVLPIHSLASSELLHQLKTCYYAGLGSKVKPGENYTVKEEFRNDGTLESRIMLVDGIPRGWAHYYDKTKKIEAKVYYDKFGQLDESKMCRFYYIATNRYARSGDGINQPLLMLNSGEPHNGYFENGSDSDFYTKLYFKNGAAHGQAHIKDFNMSLLANTEEKGIFYAGYKNGKFWVRWTGLMSAISYDIKDQVTFENHYKMGELVDSEITYAFPELVSENLLLQKLQD